MAMMVTGGAGFIGSNFIRFVLKSHEDVEVVNYDKITYAGNLESLKGVDQDKRYTFVRGDICDGERVSAVVKGRVDLIVNFAAESHVDRSIVDPSSFIRTNVEGTYVLLEAARRFDCDFVQISTDEVYGSIEKGSFKEEHALNPSSPYSASKAAADQISHSYFVTYGLPVRIVRSTNNFGPYQHPEKLVPLLVTNALRDNPLPIYGDGLNVRDWLYVEDNCAAIDLIRLKGRGGFTYNVGAGNERTNLEVAQFIVDALQRPRSLITFVEDRPGHDRRYSVDSGRVRKLGWKPSYTFEEAMVRTISWYRGNPWWWKPLISS